MRGKKRSVAGDVYHWYSRTRSRATIDDSHIKILQIGLRESRDVKLLRTIVSLEIVHRLETRCSPSPGEY